MTTAFEYKATRLPNKLYSVDRIFDKDLAAVWIKDGTLSVYCSYEAVAPANLAAMTLDASDTFSATSGNPANIIKKPTYIAFTGTATVIRTDYIQLTEVRDIS